MGGSRWEHSGPRSRAVTSTVVGTILGAVALVAIVFGTITVTGYIDAFSRDRGFLQLVVAIPLGSLLTSTALSFFRLLRPRQLLWTILPVELLILGVAGAFGGDFVAWYWAAVTNVVVFVPWLAGIAGGTAIQRRR